MFVIMWGWCKIEGIDRTTTTSSRSSITTTTTTTRSSFLSPTWRQRSIGHGGKAAWTNGLWPRQGLRAWRRQAVPLLQFPRCPLPSFLQLCLLLLLLLLLLLVFLRLLRLLLQEAEAQLAEAWRDLTQAQHRGLWPRQGLTAWRRQAVPLLQFPRCPLPSFLQLCLLLLLLLLLVFLRLLRLLLKEAEAQLAEAWRDLTQAQHRAVAAGAQRKCHVAARHSTSGCAKCLDLSYVQTSVGFMLATTHCLAPPAPLPLTLLPLPFPPPPLLTLPWLVWLALA